MKILQGRDLDSLFNQGADATSSRVPSGRPMPAWKTVLSEAEMRSALLYVRQFAKSP